MVDVGTLLMVLVIFHTSKQNASLDENLIPERRIKSDFLRSMSNMAMSLGFTLGRLLSNSYPSERDMS